MNEIDLQATQNMRWTLSNLKRLAAGVIVALCMIACTTVAPTAHAEGTPLVIDPAAMQVDLSQATYLLEDPTGTLTIDDVRKPENADRFVLGSPGVGMSTSAHWMRFSVRFGPDSHNRWWFDTGNRTLQEVALYWPGEDGRYQYLETGSTRRFGERPLATNTFTFPLTLPATGNAEIYLRVRSTGYMGIAVLPTLWSPEAYRISEKSESMLWIFMLGLAIATAAINLMLAFYNRDLNNLFYVLSILSFANGMCFAVGGIGSAYEMFIPNSPVLYQMTWIGSVGLTGVFPNIFLVRLLNLNKTFRGFKPLNIAFVSMYVAWTTLQVTLTALQRPEWAGFMQLSWAIGAFLYTLPTILLMVAISREFRRGNRSARYVFVAFTPLLITLCYVAPYTYVNGQMPWGLLLAAMLFEWYVTAAAVADKYNQVRLERAHAKQALVESLQESEQRLEAKVTLRTAELADEKQRTQDLLHNMLPVEIARELSTTGTTTPVRTKKPASCLPTSMASPRQHPPCLQAAWWPS